MRETDPEVASDLAQKAFLACSKRDLHLALVQLPLRWFAQQALPGTSPGSNDEKGALVRCLRSVLMKPEHEAWLGEIWERLLAASRETIEA